MIVPGPRLLAWTAILVVPGAGLAAALPEGRLPALALLVAFAALVAADALRSRRCLDGLAVRCPDILRLSREREGALALTLVQSGPRLGEVSVGLAFPPGFRTPHDVRRVALPAGAAASRLAWPCHALARGVYRIAQCQVQAASALGFWEVHARKPLDAEIRVYPNVLSERRAVPALFLARGHFGVRPQHQVGRGKEFEKLREYQPGDSYEDIHWKATARRGHPITKVFQIERTQEVYVAIDASRLSRRAALGEESGPEPGEPPAAILERFLTAGLVLGRAAERQGDRFGLITFSDRVRSFVRAQKGRGHYRTCVEAMCRLQAEDITPDFDDICTCIRTRLRRRALIVFLTQLDDPVLAESFRRSLALIRRTHLVVVNVITPPAVRPLFSAADGVNHVDDVYAALGGHLRWRALRELQLALRQQGVSMFPVAQEKLAAHLVTQYINIKQRQRL